MGNRLSRKKPAVDDKFTRPQGLYELRDIDHRKLRKLILDSKLAPCFPGDEDRSSAPDLEECPICFLYYPSLNRSRCCAKGICTECFLQMKPVHSMRPTQCPFCKMSNYAVEYRGERSKEEKGKEQIEEQKVIEAKIRMQQQELHEEEERRIQKKQGMPPGSLVAMPEEAECLDMSSSSVSVTSHKHTLHGEQLELPQSSHAYRSSRQTPHPRHNRESEFDLDLEELMVMEAIWLSIQDPGTNVITNSGAVSSVALSSLEDRYVSPTMVPAESPSSTGLVCAAAALAEHQHLGEGQTVLSGTGSFSYGTVPRMRCISTGERSVGHYAPDNWVEMPSDQGRVAQLNETDWATGPRPTGIGSDAVELGTSYVASNATMDVETGLRFPEGTNMFSSHIIPETFDEQMMLAMAVSLTEARPRRNTQGLAWM